MIAIYTTHRDMDCIRQVILRMEGEGHLKLIGQQYMKIQL